MEKSRNILKNIPQVEKILQSDEINSYPDLLGHPLVVKIIRNQLEYLRREIIEGKDYNPETLIESIKNACETKRLEKLQRVINGTGVILHTNLGRSPLGSEIFKKLEKSLSGYCNLEFHLPTEKRGRRGGMAEELICELTGAEDALIVNNNASSVFLILSRFASGKEVIVSRGELIQIGGGFRIPDIMNQTGACLVEVGTTNITELDDFREAITENTSMVLSAHQSNYKIEGFSHSPSLRELSGLKTDSIVFVRDLGSGNLVNERQLIHKPFEPTVKNELDQGADIVCFSGDKLLGGCQAGIIIGRKDLISELRRHPLMRMIRVDKITYFILQEILINYANYSFEKTALWQTIQQTQKELSSRINRLLRMIRNSDNRPFVKKVRTRSTFGGGAMPTLEIDSLGIEINIPDMKASDLYSDFIRRDIPVVGIIDEDRFKIDFMTVFDNDLKAIASAIDDLSGRRDSLCI